MKKRNNYQLPEAVADIFVDEILEASDEEILKMAKEEFCDVDELTENTMNLINNAVMTFKEKSYLIEENALVHRFLDLQDVASVSVRGNKLSLLDRVILFKEGGAKL